MGYPGLLRQQITIRLGAQTQSWRETRQREKLDAERQMRDSINRDYAIDETQGRS